MKPLVLPQINLNGTSKQALVDQQLEIMQAIRALQDALAQASPHGRDYQLRPAEYQPARDAWVARMALIEILRREIDDHAMAIQEMR